jgi:hypothetical protein
MKKEAGTLIAHGRERKGCFELVSGPQAGFHISISDVAFSLYTFLHFERPPLLALTWSQGRGQHESSALFRSSAQFGITAIATATAAQV